MRKLCVGPSDSTMASSVAAACSSKLKVRQNLLRSASPQPRLSRVPCGLWITRCMSPASSKKRSITRVRQVGMAPRALRPAVRYSAACSAALAGIPGSDASQAAAAGAAGSPRSSASRIAVSAPSRSSDTAADSSGVRPGASPSQKGMVGRWSPACATRTVLPATCRMRQEVLPSWNTSPAMLSMAKSSWMVPTMVSSGSAFTS